MTIRKLLDGSEVEELERPVTLQIKTRCPSKYKLIDMETGEEYVGYDAEGKNYWKPLGVKNTDA
jgi:hypothetical protein